ncbi:hypothetical protein WA158_007097 [Blastocystis sp. Blastoise]
MKLYLLLLFTVFVSSVFQDTDTSWYNEKVREGIDAYKYWESMQVVSQNEDCWSRAIHQFDNDCENMNTRDKQTFSYNVFRCFMNDNRRLLTPCFEADSFDCISQLTSEEIVLYTIYMSVDRQDSIIQNQDDILHGYDNTIKVIENANHSITGLSNYINDNLSDVQKSWKENVNKIKEMLNRIKEQLAYIIDLQNIIFVAFNNIKSFIVFLLMIGSVFILTSHKYSIHLRPFLLFLLLLSFFIERWALLYFQEWFSDILILKVIDNCRYTLGLFMVILVVRSFILGNNHSKQSYQHMKEMYKDYDSYNHIRKNHNYAYHYIPLSKDPNVFDFDNDPTYMPVEYSYDEDEENNNDENINNDNNNEDGNHDNENLDFLKEYNQNFDSHSSTISSQSRYFLRKNVPTKYILSILSFPINKYNIAS